MMFFIKDSGVIRVDENQDVVLVMNAGYFFIYELICFLFFLPCPIFLVVSALSHNDLLEIFSCACYIKAFFEAPSIARKDGDRLFAWETTHAILSKSKLLNEEQSSLSIISLILFSFSSIAIISFLFHGGLIGFGIVGICIFVFFLGLGIFFSALIWKALSVKAILGDHGPIKPLFHDYLDRAVELNVLTPEEKEVYLDYCKRHEYSSFH